MQVVKVRSEATCRAATCRVSVCGSNCALLYFEKCALSQKLKIKQVSNAHGLYARVSC